MEIWAWLNNQLLKMQWLSDLVKRLVEAVFGLSMQSPWAFGGTAPSFGARSWVAIYAGERCRPVQLEFYVIKSKV